MKTITIELPDEVEQIVAALGTDLNSYIAVRLIKPLMDHLKDQEEKKIVAAQRLSIDAKVRGVEKSIKVGKPQ